MIESYSWLTLADEMVRNDVDAEPGDAALRRAVSTAYYALFHLVAQSAADLFVGAERRGSTGYQLCYRSLDHGHLKTACAALAQPTLPPRERKILGRDKVSEDAKIFADAVLVLQEARHSADYDQRRVFGIDEVRELLKIANRGYLYFLIADRDEPDDILALILFRARQ